MKDGGPAFPHSMEAAAIGSPSVGMSLRDYFAVAALQGRTPATDETWADLAKLCWTIADSMIAEREKS